MGTCCTAIGLVLLTYANSDSDFERSTSLVFFQNEGMDEVGALRVRLMHRMTLSLTSVVLRLVGNTKSSPQLLLRSMLEMAVLTSSSVIPRLM